MKKSALFTRAAAFILTAALSLSAYAMPRSEIAKVANAKKCTFKYWTKDSYAKKALTDYVKAVTDRKSTDFIPVKDRIAVFDMDGTLISETSDYYMEWYVYLYRVLKDSSYEASPEMKEHALEIGEAMKAHRVTGEMNDIETPEKIQCLAGLNGKDMHSLMEKVCNEETSHENLKRGETFYLPMVEVVSYLVSNGFKVFIVTGADREIARIFVEDVLPVDSDNVIGADTSYAGSTQGEKQNWEYTFKKGEDVLIRTDFVGNRDVAMDKATNIWREIGKQPVLSFGNSSGDTSMHEFTLSDNKYRSMAFSLCCDDTVREFGNVEKAEKMKKTCEKNGWIPVSMRDDWNTIYGEDVVKKQ